MTLLAHLWQSTLCVGLAALVAFVMRRSPARTRHAIWLCASLKFLVPFSLLAAAGEAIGGWTLPLATPDAVAGWLDRSLSLWSLDSRFASGAIAAGVLAGVPGATVAALAAVWLAGAVAIAAWRWRLFRAIGATAATAPRLDHGREADALRRLTGRSTRLRPLDLALCETKAEPGVLGLFRPTLLWPRGLSDRLEDPELEAILAHELCHARRRDNLSALAHMAVETLFWFHPVVWWLGARLVDERERACDEEVLHMGTDTRSYAGGMLKVCGFCLRAPVACVAGVGGGNLSRRVERIMTRSLPSPLSRPARLLLASVALVVLAAPVATGILGAEGRHDPARGDRGAQQKKVYRLGGEGVKAPKLVFEVKPKYTEAARREKIQGSVTVEAVVVEDGSVGDVAVTRSLDAVYGLDEQAVEAARQWRFEPGTKDGKAVPVLVEIEMTFKLK